MAESERLTPVQWTVCVIAAIQNSLPQLHATVVSLLSQVPPPTARGRE